MSDSIDSKDFNQPDRASLDNTDVGSVAQAVLTLTKELWVMRDRLAVLEAVLAEKGIDVSEDADRYQPNEEMQKQLDEQAKKLVVAILDALNGR